MAFVPTVAAGVYVRISRDRHHDGLGVARQENDCRALVRRRGWHLAEVYSDDDRSAYSKRPRPGYQQLLADLRSGQIGAVVTWHPDRLYRRMMELEDLVELLESRTVEVATVRAGEIDLATPSGRLNARLMAAVARHESEHKAERQQRKHEELAEKGRWKGGPRPYGYERSETEQGMLVIVTAEATLIREAAERVLSGESVHAVCRDWNGRHVATTRGGQWRPPTLLRILTAPSVGGQREYRGKVVGRAAWEPILDEASHVRLLAALGTKASRPIPARVSWLTGGLITCGVCSKPLRSQRRQDSGARVYACPPGASHGGCGRIQAQADPVERFVAEALFAAIDSPTLARRVAASRRTERVVPDTAALEAQLADLADGYGNGAFTPGEWQAARAPLLRRLDEARAAQLAGNESAVLLPFVGREVLRESWPQLGLDQKRAIAGAVLDHITVRRSTVRGRNFDPRRLDFTWRA